MGMEEIRVHFIISFNFKEISSWVAEINGNLVILTEKYWFFEYKYISNIPWKNYCKTFVVK